MKRLRDLWYGFLYYFSWLLFGLIGLLLNVALAPGLLLPRRERLAPFARGAIQTVFSLWIKWLNACGVVRVSWVGAASPLPRGAVYVANHPTLVDATFLLARLPDAVCIFKPALLRNPVIAPAALLAGYLAGDQGVDTVRAATHALAAGRSLLIFPEGTRTALGRTLNPLRPGFALIARRAAAPVQIFRIRASPCLTTRGRAWWRLPPLPGWVELHRDALLPADGSETDTTRLLASVEARLHAPWDS